MPGKWQIFLTVRSMIDINPICYTHTYLKGHMTTVYIITVFKNILCNCLAMASENLISGLNSAAFIDNLSK